MSRFILAAALAVLAAVHKIDGQALTSAALQADSATSPIRINRVHMSRPNAMGAVDVEINWTNTSPKVVKYIRFTVKWINAVGDAVPDQIAGDSLRRLVLTGPFEPGTRVRRIYWPSTFYNSNARCVQVLAVRIEYMDGTETQLDEAAVRAATDSRVRACPAPPR